MTGGFSRWSIVFATSAAGHGSHRHRGIGWSEYGCAGFGDGFVRTLSHYRQAKHVCCFALVSGHAQRCVTLEMFHCSEAFLMGLLYVFGGEVIRGFVYALIFGIAIGTYSSIFVASPVLLLMNIRRDTQPPHSPKEPA